MPAMLRTLRCILLVSAVVLAATPARGQQASELRKVGTTGMTFLELPLSPRTAAIGDIRGSERSPGADALFNNPALAGFATDRHLLSISNTQWIAGTQYQSLAYVYNLGTAGALGLSVARLDMGTMQGSQNAVPGQPGSFVLTDEFSAESIVGGLTYSRQMTDRFSFGGTLKYATERIDVHRASAFAVDIGMLYYTGFRTLRIGGLLQNFGTDAAYLNDTFKLPITFRISSAMEVMGEMGSPNRLTLSMEAMHPNNADQRLHLGLEYAPVAMMMLRGGYKFGYDEESLTLGIGLTAPGAADLGVDFVYGHFNRLGRTLGFGIRAAL
jgi:hypothetical protein